MSGNRGDKITGATYVERPSARELFQAFDVLPGSVRSALRNAAFDIDPRPIARRLVKGASEADVIKAIMDTDRNNMRRAYVDRGAQ